MTCSIHYLSLQNQGESVGPLNMNNMNSSSRSRRFFTEVR